jgi:hypothetical protein
MHSDVASTARSVGADRANLFHHFLRIVFHGNVYVPNRETPSERVGESDANAKSGSHFMKGAFRHLGRAAPPGVKRLPQCEKGLGQRTRFFTDDLRRNHRGEVWRGSSPGFRTGPPWHFKPPPPRHPDHGRRRANHGLVLIEKVEFFRRPGGKARQETLHCQAAHLQPPKLSFGRAPPGAGRRSSGFDTRPNRATGPFA